MPLTQKSFLRAAGDRNVIWVDPAKVTFRSGSKWPVGKHRIRQLQQRWPVPIVNLFRAGIKGREPFLIPTQHYGPLERITQTPRYEKVADFIEHRENVTASLWYRDLMEALNETGLATHKTISMRSEAEVVDFLNSYFGALVTSMQTKGYSDPKGGYESAAVINQDGSITKTGSGNHRFCVSKALKLKKFPLRIVGAHENWQPVKDMGPHLSTERILALIPNVAAAHQ